MNRDFGFLFGGVVLMLSSMLSDKGMIFSSEVKLIGGFVIFGYGLVRIIMKRNKEK